MSGLEIPERAVQTACEIFSMSRQSAFEDVTFHQWATGLLNDVSPIIVATELRRLATESNPWCGAGTWLCKRADELDPEGATQ